MYTTPRKVKQESRLRRSLSLTNANQRLNGGLAPTMSTANGDDYCSGEYHRHLHDIEESKDSNTYFPFNGNLNLNSQRSRYSYTNGDAEELTFDSAAIPDLVDCSSSNSGDNSIVVNNHSSSNHYPPQQNPHYAPPPYRVPPPGEIGFGQASEDLRSDPLLVVTPSDPHHQGVPDSPISLNSLQIHSSKFPFTLDSNTAKDIQQRLASYPITKASSADLGKAIQDFNAEQTRLMSSMQGARRLNGVDNPALDLGGSNGQIHQQHPSSSSLSFSANGGSKMASYNYPDSSTSQSQSLSSSNTDSLDTVIYKGPPQSTPSIRDWQRSMESNGEFHNAYHRDTTGMHASYQMQQQQQHPSSSYTTQMQQQKQQYTSNNGLQGPLPTATGGSNSSGYAIEYRHSQQQHQVQQNLSQLSVHSIPSSSTGNGGVLHNNVRSGSGSYGSNPQLAAKSPMLSHKQFSTAITGQQQQQQQLDQRDPGSRGVTFGTAVTTTASTDPMLLDKSKDSKLFPSKTYNHIKDMISSRFGGATTGISNPNNHSSNNKGLNNVVNGGVNNNTVVPGSDQNTANSYIDLTMGVPASYPNNNVAPTGSGMNGHSSYNGMMMNRNNNNGPSSAHYPQQVSGNSSANNMPPPNSYRSPNMNDRKNVNTSFRKAIQQSTLKSNLTEDSLQLRPIHEAQQLSYNSGNNNNGMQQFSSGNNGGNQQQKEIVVVQERAQRALDQLMEGGSSSSGLNHSHNPTVYNRVQQFSSAAGVYPGENHQHASSGRIQQQQQGGSRVQLLHPQGPIMGRSSYNGVKPGPGSSNSNSSSGLQMVESSLSSPGSYNGNRVLSGESRSSEEVHASGLHQHHPQWSHTHHQHQSSSVIHPHNDQPPPLPTSKKPGSPEGSMNTIGLPLPSVQRENGDGSSATMETNAGSSILLEANSTANPSSCSKVKSDQLKQITTDLQNIALSVAAEHHLHNSASNNSNNNKHHHSSSSEECEKGGPQRVGSGQSHTTTDSGLGTVMLTKSPLNSNSDPGDHGLADGRPNAADSLSSGNDSEQWVDLVEPEIRHILEIERNSKSGKPGGGRPPVGNGLISGVSTSTPSVTKQFQPGGGSSSATIPHHPSGNTNGTNTNAITGSGKLPQTGHGMADISASPIVHAKAVHSPKQSPKLSKNFDLNAYNAKKTVRQSQELLSGPSTSQAAAGAMANKIKSPRVPAKVQRSNSGAGGQQRWPNNRPRVPEKSPKAGGSRPKEFTQTLKGAKITRNAMTKLGQLLNSLQDETGELTSTTGLDFETFDGHTEFTTDDDDLSTTIDTTDAHAIRRQLESLESMYTEVLKVLGEKKFSRNHKYPPNTADLRAAKRRPYGSMSSLPSSVSSRPFRDRSRKLEDKKKVKDLKSINRRFQRLESHVVTLARSVAHLSSEMRTQHLMVQEMESIRNELATLRNQVVKNSAQSASQNFTRAASGRHGGGPCANQTDWTAFRNALPSLTNPCRVRKLTQFFGDEPPLIRIFLKKLGYEKYASAFEQERIGIMELPYLTEERLNKMGIPMGPRLRILQEAQICLKPGYHGHHDSHHPSNNHNTGNLSVYVV
ncbi:uncharacterized protein DDB_G0283357 isoform X3 [Folsomia candida]|uniref:uncharacterized protein DDB_G0283357 isoform X3 n=1 Tax=Folsomia candida TaxID=158441 RepID=UPI001604E45A|nr:uncharacterized protein DDB_G0283357 isoform X3 [Folsomia candida]